MAENYVMGETAALLPYNNKGPAAAVGGASSHRPFVPARALQFANAGLFMLASVLLLVELVMFEQKMTYPGIAGCLPPYNFTSCISLPAKAHPYTGTPDNVAVPFALANFVGFLSSLMFCAAFVMLIYFLHIVMGAGAVVVGTATVNLVASVVCTWQPIASLTGRWNNLAEAAYGGPNWTNLLGISLLHTGSVVNCFLMWKHFVVHPQRARARAAGHAVGPERRGATPEASQARGCAAGLGDRWRALWYEENLTITGMWIFTAATTLLVAGNALNFLVEHPHVAQRCSIGGAILLVLACGIYMYAARPAQWWFFRPHYVFINGAAATINGAGLGYPGPPQAPAAAHQAAAELAPPPPPPPPVAEILEIRASKAAVAAELAAAKANLAAVQFAVAGLERTHAQLERLEALELEQLAAAGAVAGAHTNAGAQ